MKSQVFSHQFDPTHGIDVRIDPHGNPAKPVLTLREHCYSNGVVRVCVPKGTRSDLASVPWYFHWLFCPLGRHVRAALFHDDLYGNPRMGLKRRVVDACFYQWLRHDRVGPVRAWLMFAAVRLFGGRHWRAARSARGAGR